VIVVIAQRSNTEISCNKYARSVRFLRVLIAWATKGASRENHRNRIARCTWTFRLYSSASVRTWISRRVLRACAVLRRRRLLRWWRTLSQRTLSVIFERSEAPDEPQAHIGRFVSCRERRERTRCSARARRRWCTDRSSGRRICARTGLRIRARAGLRIRACAGGRIRAAAALRICLGTWPSGLESGPFRLDPRPLDSE